MDKKIYCIIPAYNEEKTICEVVKEVKNYTSEVVVVDDCSSDDTFDLARESGATVLRHAINRDQGAALRTGNEYALKNGADIIVHFDADGQFMASEIKDLLKPLLNDEYDLVLGSRFLEKKSRIPFFKKNIIFPIARFINLFFLSINLTDPQCGFRAFSSNVANKISIEQDGKAHCSEILIKAKKNNLRIKEVPVTVFYNNFGQKFSGGIRIIKDLFLAQLIK